MERRGEKESGREKDEGQEEFGSCQARHSPRPRPSRCRRLHFIQLAAWTGSVAVALVQSASSSQTQRCPTAALSTFSAIRRGLRLVNRQDHLGWLG
ncbi:uncharacterized protein BDV14DRAFT_164882 [Aspergillus stella-maris]|uniref:uncharacterized protein n=1 Tax=Aspergillus stella-maris TaxID=1810926 RepID=UPI003CCE2216